LDNVVIPDGISKIGMSVFSGCKSLRKITIPESITIIDNYAFSKCSALAEITFMGSAPAVGKTAFNSLITTVYYPVANKTWTEDVMQDYGGTITWVPYGDVREEYTVEWKSAAPSLNGTIDLTVFAVLSENLLDEEDAFVRFQYANTIVDIPVSQATPSVRDGVLRYGFRLPMFAKQVSETVTFQFMKGDEVIGETKQYSIMKYCTNKINDPSSSAKLVTMCKALLNYAAAAQISLNYNTGSLANAGLSDADKVLPENFDVSMYKSKLSGEEKGIRFRSASLILRDEIYLVAYIALEDGYDISDFTFTIDGEKVEVQKDAKGYFIRTKGIPAKHMEEMHTFRVGGHSLSYGPMSYVRNKLIDEDTTPDLLNMVKALYGYYAAAEAFFS
jgi:hypothetical protein